MSDAATVRSSLRVAVIGPVFPYRAGIAYCTTRLAEELRATFDVTIVSFSRQYPKAFYPGSDDVDETLREQAPADAHYILDVINPLSWIATGLALRRQRLDAVIFVWWIWVWALPYRLLMALLPRRTTKIVQCHNVGDKEPAAWKRILTNLVLRRADILVTHAASEWREGWRRSRGRRTLRTFLPVHELGRAMPSRADARRTLGIAADANVALCFGHVRPFKAVDVALRAWSRSTTAGLLIVAGEAWWESAESYRKLARELRLHDDPSGAQQKSVRFDFRFIPDSEIAEWFAAADVVLVPYRIEAQSGVALTAFHFGRPVIASMVGGLPEIIEPGKNGLLVPSEDPAALASAIDHFFAAPDRKLFGTEAARSAERYSWPEYAALFARLIVEC